MKGHWRITVFLIGAVCLAYDFIWAFAGLAPFGAFDGRYGLWLNQFAVRERHALSVVAAVVCDYRGFDTLGEELILFTAVTGITLLLRNQSREVPQPPDEDLPGREVPATSAAMRLCGIVFIAFGVIFSLYMILHGHLSPGGGFQGGAILSSSVALLYIAIDYDTFSRLIHDHEAEIAEAAGVIGFVAVGLSGVFSGAAFLQNLFPLGIPGTLFSAGAIPLINFFIGIAVGGGLILMTIEFMKQTLLLRDTDEPAEEK